MSFNCSVFLPLLIVGAALAQTSCTDCPITADPVRTDPETKCLSLHLGHVYSDAGSCSIPSLEGVNNCSEKLTLSPGDVFAPGDKIAWAINERLDGVTVINHGDDDRDYVIAATLGSESLTITLTVHDE